MQVIEPFLSLICSAMIKQVQKHGEYHDGALLTLSDWFYQLVASVASGLHVKRNIDSLFDTCLFVYLPAT